MPNPLDQIKRLEKVRSQEKGKYYGECIACEQETVLLKETEMCGPCTFGEAETLYGNW
jgi:hypothetical protein